MNHQSKTDGIFHHDLNELIGGLMKSLLPEAMDNKSYLINEIPEKLILRTDRQLVAAVLDGMLSIAVKYARETYVRLSAKVYGHVILVHIGKQGMLNSAAIHQDVSRLQGLAEKILGTVSINSERKGSSTLTFGFPNLPPLA